MADGKDCVGQALALVCCVIDMVLILLCLTSSDWLVTTGWRQGLFSHCIEENAPTPLPFNVQEKPGCYQIREEGYIQLSATMCIVVFVTDMVAATLIILGLRSNDYRNKYKFFKCAMWVSTLALMALITALVLYPVMFKKELSLVDGNREIWEFGWAYGAGCGAAIFLAGIIVLLYFDKQSEQIYYKERKVMST